MSYKPSNFMKEAIASGDEYKIKGALIGVIMSDSSFSTGEIDSAINYVNEHGYDIFEANDDDYEIENNSLMWDKDYLASAINFLQRNFSRERLAHVKQVGRKVYGSPVSPSANSVSPTPKASSQRESSASHASPEPTVSPAPRVSQPHQTPPIPKIYAEAKKDLSQPPHRVEEKSQKAPVRPNPSTDRPHSPITEKRQEQKDFRVGRTVAIAAAVIAAAAIIVKLLIKLK